MATDAADALLERITALSAPRSVLALDHIRDSPALRAARAAVSPDIVALWQGGPVDLTAWLTHRGWRPNVHDLQAVAAVHGRTVPTVLIDPAADGGGAWLATATR